MLAVNNAGRAREVYSQLEHAAWHGLTAADVVFPMFLFASGTALGVRDGRMPPWPRALRRAGVLVGLGLVLNLVRSNGALADLRVMGVLQRIGLAWFGAWLVLHLPRWAQVLLAAVLLLGTWAALSWFAAPGQPPGSLTPEANLAGWIDRVVLGRRHVYLGGPFDPEGLLGTLPSIVSVLLGAWAGRWAGAAQRRARVIDLSLAAAVLLGLGAWWSVVLPLNKALWTGSFVLVAGGWSLLAFAALVALVDVGGQRWLGWPLEVLGRNALVVYVGAELARYLLPRVTVAVGGATGDPYAWLDARLAPTLGVLGVPVAVLACCWIVAALLHWRGWTVRV